jgi:exonuclease SbcC
MIHNIHIQGGFAHKDASFDFSVGLTGITGLNGTGKSEILTSIRFALFGSGALRTAASDHKGYKVQMEFTVKGVRYGVDRSITNAKLTRMGEIIATGTRPVNQKIISIFGYGLEVFDVANAANQGVIEALSSMKPTERKRMVDQTVGLDVLDDLILKCSNEARQRTGVIEGLRAGSVEPIEPPRPEQCPPLVVLQERAEFLRERDGQARDLARLLAQRPPEVPEPFCVETRSLDELEAAQRRRRAALGELERQLGELAGVPQAVRTEAELDAAEQGWDIVYEFIASREWLARHGTGPGVTAGYLDQCQVELNSWADYQEWAKLHAAGEHECPACQHRWPVNAASMGHLQDWKGKEAPPKPDTNAAQIKAHRARLDQWDAEAELRATHQATIARLNGKPAPLIPNKDIPKLRAALTHAARRAALTASIEALEQEVASLPDLTGPHAVRWQYERDLGVYTLARDCLNEWEAVREEREAKLAAIGDVSEQLRITMDLIVEVQTFERLMETYTSQKVKYDLVQERVRVAEAEVINYLAAKKALTELKAKVKTFLVPSLSKVASLLVAEMTGGALTDIVVNEEFDITVDGRKIEGMSGAEKAAVNIALRLGLGRVLTHKVFSVFMADEIDSSMDDHRAVYTAQCLRNMTKNIAQIVLVSHKKPDADHYIHL